MATRNLTTSTLSIMKHSQWDVEIRRRRTSIWHNKWQPKSPQPTTAEQVSSHSKTPRRLVRHHRTGSREKRRSFEVPTRRRCSSVQTTPRQRNVERPNEGVNYYKRFLRPHFIKGAQAVFLHRFMQFMKHNSGTMDLQRWMTRFQLTASRLIESWMDLIPDLDLTAPDVTAAIAQRRTAHEKQQQNLVGIAQATRGAQPHVVVPSNDEMSRQVLVQLNNARRQQQRTLFPLSWQFVSIDSCKSGRLDAGSKEHLDEYHDTSWSNISSIQCARTQRSLFGDVLHYRYSSGQSNDATLWHGTEKILPRHGWRWDWWTTGYWAEDEDDGAEGFLEALEDVFWVYDDTEYTWYQRRVPRKTNQTR